MFGINESWTQIEYNTCQRQSHWLWTKKRLDKLDNQNIIIF